MNIETIDLGPREGLSLLAVGSRSGQHGCGGERRDKSIQILYKNKAILDLAPDSTPLSALILEIC